MTNTARPIIQRAAWRRDERRRFTSGYSVSSLCSNEKRFELLEAAPVQPERAHSGSLTNCSNAFGLKSFDGPSCGV